jgi:beta-lactamase class A
VEGRSLKESYLTTKEKYQRKNISRWWLVVIGALLLLLVEIGVQMFYPAGMSRPNSFIDDIDVSQKNAAEIENILLETYQNQKITVENPQGEQVEFSLAELGASVDVSAQVAAALDYSLGMRFVPLSAFWLRNLEIYPQTELGIDTNLSQKEPLDASIVLEHGQLRVIEAQPGLRVGDKDEDLGDELCTDELVLRANVRNIIHCNIKVLQPDISTDVAEGVVNSVKTALQDGLVFNYQNERVVEASFEDAISWLGFTPNILDNTIDVVVSIDKITEYLGKTELARLNQSAESNKVDMINGTVTAQTTGKAGWGINYQGVVDQISQILAGEATSDEITIELAHIYPGTIYDRVFTDNFEGLAAELDYLYGDKNVAIVTLDLTGQGRNISINEWKQFTAASTYKLYVAYSMLKSGSPPDCFEAMIINSDNACPNAWLEARGLKNVEAEAHEVGASGVTYFGDYDMRTSAMDLANFLSRIYRKELPIDTDRLISDMQVQRFRSGIPAGLGGNAVVADKVGFLWGLLHDAGIVYSNKGDYIQVILTDGYSWETIAEIAGRIYGKM